MHVSIFRKALEHVCTILKSQLSRSLWLCVSPIAYIARRKVVSHIFETSYARFVEHDDLCALLLDSVQGGCPRMYVL